MRRLLMVLAVGLAVLVACGPGPVTSPTKVPVEATVPAPGETPAQEPALSPIEAPTMAPLGVRKVRVMTHDSFDISEEVIEAFETRYSAEVEILQAGDAGVVLNQAILSADNPLADVLYGVDNTLLTRALDADIFERYKSPLLLQIPDQLKLDAGNQALPVDHGYVCLNYDKAWFAGQGLTPPAGLEDLVKPEYRSLTVVENAATSSPGLAFMLATVGHFGEAGDYTWLDYWADLRANDVRVVEGWEDAYYGQFTHGSGGEGERPIVVSYASSPPAEVYFAERPLEEAPTGVVTGPGSCFHQIEFVGILKGTQDRALAEAWVDYMLDRAFQEDIPLHMFMFPANQSAILPEVFVRFAVVPDQPAQVDYPAIEANREAWIEAWTEVVLR